MAAVVHQDDAIKVERARGVMEVSQVKSAYSITDRLMDRRKLGLKSQVRWREREATNDKLMKTAGGMDSREQFTPN